MQSDQNIEIIAHCNRYITNIYQNYFCINNIIFSSNNENMFFSIYLIVFGRTPLHLERLL